MSCKTMLVLTVFATLASVILSSPQRVVQTLPFEIPDAAKEVVAEYFAEKLEEGLPQMEQLIQTRTGSLFNLSSYINAAGRPNGTALTVVPLITLLSGLFSG